jgi:GT2 family glycosyltransferase
MITASIVIYHPHKDMLKTLLDSVKESNSVDKLWIIDNAPSIENDWVKTYLPYIDYVENENTGYGHAHNIAMRRAVEAGSTYHVILNPDIEFSANAVLLSTLA